MSRLNAETPPGSATSGRRPRSAAGTAASAPRAVAEDRLRRPLLEDPPGVEEADAVRDVAREAHLVRRDQHRHPAARELADDVEHLRHELRVERARHLVEEEQPRLHRERPHDRDALLLAAGEPVRVLVPLVGEPEALEERLRTRGRVRLRGAERLARRERDVLEHAHVREEVEGLEDDPDLASDAVHVDAARRHLLAGDRDAARVDRLEEVHAAQERRLARAGRADQAHDLVLGERQVDPAEHLELAEGLVDALELQCRASALTRASPPAVAAGPGRRASP